MSARSRMQRGAAMAATVLVAGAVVFVSRGRSSRDADGPEECVTAMVAAEKEGDTGSFLKCFDGPLQTRLAEKQRDGKAREAIASDGQNGSRRLAGHVTTDVRVLEHGRTTLVLERIYVDHHERQRIELRHVEGEWKIIDVTPLEQFAPVIPYGTPVVRPLEKVEEGKAKDEG